MESLADLKNTVSQVKLIGTYDRKKLRHQPVDGERSSGKFVRILLKAGGYHRSRSSILKVSGGQILLVTAEKRLDGLPRIFPFPRLELRNTR
jgi:hypothetical protein